MDSARAVEIPTRSASDRPALLVDGRPVTTVEVAKAFVERSRGLLGRDGIEGALLLEPAMSVHTIGMRFTLDVAFCDRHGRVLAVREVRPWRLTRLRPRCRSVLEAEAGSFVGWGVVPGSVLTVGSRPGGGAVGGEQPVPSAT